MNLTKDSWSRQDYIAFLEYINDQTDVTYQKFHQGLVVDGRPILGIRTPKLKEIAKAISKGNYREFISLNRCDTYDEVIIQGFILGYLKIPFEELLCLIDEFIPLIDNWAINDCVCANLKQFKQNQERGFTAITTYLSSKNPWQIRFGLVLLLDFYINDTYIDEIFKQAEQVTNDDYYVKMANAWLISMCYIKYPKKTKKFLRRKKLDRWTYNKAIQKICESRKVSNEEKEILKTWKR